MIRGLVLILLISSFYTNLISQNFVSEESIRQRFPRPEKIEWLRYYKGRIDDFNDIQVVLAYDGFNCKGQLMYLRSKEIFQLDGMLLKDELDLKEIDKSGNQSGSLKGYIKGNTLTIDWSNHDFSIGSKMFLKEARQLSKVPTHCGNDKWLKKYVAKSENQQVELFLQKGGDNQIWGIAYLGNDSFKVKGEIDSKNRLNLSLIGSREERYTLKSDFKNQRNFKADVDQKGKVKTFQFRLKEHLSMGCQEYADYATSYDATYPKTKNAAFNDWIEKQIKNWINECQSELRLSKTSSLDPKTRASKRASAWCDLEYYSNEIISGFITFSKNWDDTPREIAFNFNLKTGRAIIEERLFKSHFERSFFIKNAAANYFKNHSLYSNVDFKDWIQTTSFPHFTIRKDGINFSTDFDVFYGRHSMTVPWQELKQFLRKRNDLSDLIK